MISQRVKIFLEQFPLKFELETIKLPELVSLILIVLALRFLGGVISGKTSRISFKKESKSILLICKILCLFITTSLRTQIQSQTAIILFQTIFQQLASNLKPNLQSLLSKQESFLTLKNFNTLIYKTNISKPQSLHQIVTTN